MRTSLDPLSDIYIKPETQSFWRLLVIHKEIVEVNRILCIQIFSTILTNIFVSYIIIYSLHKEFSRENIQKTLLVTIIIFNFRHKKTSRRTRSPSKSRRTSSVSVISSHHGDKFTYDERHIAKYRTSSACSTSTSRMTPPLPDLRVDFFSESSNNQKHHVPMEGVMSTHSLGVGNGTSGNVVSLEKRGSVCLNKCLREVRTDVISFL